MTNRFEMLPKLTVEPSVAFKETVGSLNPFK